MYIIMCNIVEYGTAIHSLPCPSLADQRIFVSPEIDSDFLMASDITVPLSGPDLELILLICQVPFLLFDLALIAR